MSQYFSLYLVLFILCVASSNSISAKVWWDPWIDGMVMKNSFSRFFDLATNKMATVAEMYSLGWGEEGEAWKWRRRLLA